MIFNIEVTEIQSRAIDPIIPFTLRILICLIIAKHKLGIKQQVGVIYFSNDTIKLLEYPARMKAHSVAGSDQGPHHP